MVFEGKRKGGYGVKKELVFIAVKDWIPLVRFWEVGELRSHANSLVNLNYHIV